MIYATANNTALAKDDLQRSVSIEEGEGMFFKKRTRQELWCHSCEHYVQFVLDMRRDGNHVLECPNCKHEHCRVVKDGRITDIRWDQRNGPTIHIYTCTASTAMVYTAGSYTVTMATGTYTSGST